MVSRKLRNYVHLSFKEISVNSSTLNSMKLEVVEKIAVYCSVYRIIFVNKQNVFIYRTMMISLIEYLF